MIVTVIRKAPAKVQERIFEMSPSMRLPERPFGG